MQHKLPPVPVRIVLVLILVIGGYYAVRSLQGNDNGALTASGTIEATIVNVSPEMAGKVKEVLELNAAKGIYLLRINADDRWVTRTLIVE